MTKNEKPNEKQSLALFTLFFSSHAESFVVVLLQSSSVMEQS